MSDKTNGEVKPNGFAVTVDELISVCEDTLKMFDERDTVINTHADVLGLHRFILEKFVPKPMLEQAVKDYYAQRTAEIEAVKTPDAEAN